MIKTKSKNYKVITKSNFRYRYSAALIQLYFECVVTPLMRYRYSAALIQLYFECVASQLFKIEFH
jgi:hypothetical protein